MYLVKEQKTYYVDDHEKEEQVNHLLLFTNRYLAELLEHHMHRWILLTLEESQQAFKVRIDYENMMEMEKDGFILN